METKAITAQPFSVPRLWKTLRREVLERKFVQDVGALTFGNFVGAGLSLVQGVIVARWLGPESYGVAALVMSYPGLLYTFFDARSSDASVKYLSEFHARGERDRALAMCKLGYAVDFGVASLSFATVWLTASWASRHVVGRPETVGLILVFAAASIPGALIDTSYSIMATCGRFRLIGSMQILMAAFRTVLVLGLVFSGWQVAGVIWGNVAATIATGLLYGTAAWVIARRIWGVAPLRGSWRMLKGRRREIFRFLAISDLNALLGMVPQRLDIVLLGYFRNPGEVGYYKLAKSFASGVNYLTGPLGSVTYPELSRLAGLRNPSGLRAKVRRLAVQAGLPLAALAIIGIFLLPPVIRFLVGGAYLPAISAGQILIAANCVWLAGFWLRPLFLSVGKLAWWTSAGVISLALAAPFLPALAWSHGALGVAWWSFSLNCLAAMLVIIRLRRAFEYVAS